MERGSREEKEERGEEGSSEVEEMEEAFVSVLNGGGCTFELSEPSLRESERLSGE